MSVGYVFRRFLIFLVVVWAAATFNFLLPRLGGQNPIRQKLVAQSALSGAVQAGLEEMVKEYEIKFGLDKPLWKQYLIYLSDMARFDFNYSIANYPRKVVDIMAEAIPWSFALLFVTTLLAFIIGNILGALHGVAGRAEIPELRDAAGDDARRHSVLLARPHPRVHFRFLSRRLPDVRRLPDGHHPHTHAPLYFGRLLALHAAGAVDHPGFDGRLGAWHAVDDDHDPGRRLCDLR